MVSWSEHLTTGSWIDVDDVNIFYVMRGFGQPVVFLHGWAASSFSWRKTLPVISQHFRALALDLPGFGLSKRPPTGISLSSVTDILMKALDRLGVEKFCLVGHSMGGAISAHIAAQYPERVDRLVLVNPSLVGGDDGRRPLAMELARKRFISTLITRLFVRKYFIKRVLSKIYVDKSALDDEAVEGYYESVKRAGPVLVEAGNIWRDFRTDCVYDIRCPKLFVLGGMDNVVPFRKNLELAQKIGAEIHVEPDAGHSVHEEKAESFNNVILRFLRG
ncbi:MAG: alpha/beta hydrolase [Aigarchaeota archaeon]|nr:alpha/beta hydrolase [Candidatus Caldarchaeales archaeon]